MILIIDLNQKVTIKWFTRNVAYYKELGYTYTNIGDTFEIPLYHLNKDSNYKVKAVCDCCGKEVETPYRNYNKIINKGGIYRCKSCRSKNNNEVRKADRNDEYYERFLTACKEHGYEPVTKRSEMDGCETMVKYICPKHGEQEINLSRFWLGCGCLKCAHELVGERMKHTPDEICEIIHSKNNNILLNPTEYIGTCERNLKIKCGVCGKIFITSLASYSNSNGNCPDCANRVISEKLKLSKDDLLKKMAKNPKAEISNLDDYESTTKRNLYAKCTECGKIYKTNVNDYVNKNLTRCSKCVSKMSYGEYYLYNLFDAMELRFEYQKRFKDCKDKRTLPFDFYLTDYNMCVEFDGNQHYYPIRGLDNFEITQKHDKIKNEYCAENNIRLLRIPSSDYENIFDIIINELNSA